MLTTKKKLKWILRSYFCFYFKSNLCFNCGHYVYIENGIPYCNKLLKGSNMNKDALIREIEEAESSLKDVKVQLNEINDLQNRLTKLKKSNEASKKRYEDYIKKSKKMLKRL